jgi:hypothetical protein
LQSAMVNIINPEEKPPLWLIVNSIILNRNLTPEIYD